MSFGNKKRGRKPGKKIFRKGYKPRRSVVSKARQIVKKEISKLGLKPEIKRNDTTYSVTDATMGQVAGNANAYYAADITPVIAQGSGVGQRIGNVIQIRSFFMSLQLRQMSGATAPVRIDFYIVKTKGDAAPTPAALTENIFNYNSYLTGSNIVDAGSNMNTDYFGEFRMIRKWRVYMKPDNFTGQQMPKLVTIGHKFRVPHALRYFSTAGTNILGERYYMIALASNGNASTTTASTVSNVPVTSVSTGQYINFDIKWYYTDA